MRYFIDTEFNEDGRTIVLISIGLVADDGRELYAVSNEVKREDCNPWVQDNVWPTLHEYPDTDATSAMVDSRASIRCAIEQFIGDDQLPEFWGYYADYDWVVFCWLWGAMVDLPRRWPKFCLDLKQEAHRIGVRLSDLVPDPVGAHNALVDARWIRDAHSALAVRR